MNRILFIVLLSLTAASGVLAQPFEPPWLIPYQGRFENADGNPMPAGEYPVIFGLWDSENGGGPPFWAEAHMIIVDNDGLFEVCLGEFDGIDVATWPANDQVWLALGYNEEFLTPRVPFKAVPFAFIAQNVREFGNMTPEEFQQSVVNQLSPRFMVDGRYTRSTEDFDILSNSTVQFTSDPYLLPYGSYVKYYGYTGVGINMESGQGTAMVELINQFDAVVASSLTTGTANPGSPAIFAITNGEVPAGTYRTRVTFGNTDHATYQGWEVGAVWQGETR